MELTVADTQIQAWIQQVLWPMFRIGGMAMTLPVVGDRTTPMRIRLIFVIVLTLAVAPLTAGGPVLSAFSAEWWLRSGQECLLGILCGFVFKLVFEASVLAGELIGNSMGLGFARMTDPVRGTDSPVIGQFLSLMFALLFVSVGGISTLVEAAAQGLHVRPAAGAVLAPAVFFAIAEFAVHTFAGALSIALPIMASLMLVNLAFGVMSRSAPSLNALSVGFPMALLAGLLLLWLVLPSLGRHFRNLFDIAAGFMAALLGI